jgi:hypothetical protein
MANTTRSRLGGLGVVAQHGPAYMADNGRKGATALDRRIAAEAGIPDGLPDAEYQARLAAARSAYYIRLAEARWSRVADSKARAIVRRDLDLATASAEAALADEV